MVCKEQCNCLCAFVMHLAACLSHCVFTSCRKLNGEDSTLTRPGNKWAEKCPSDLIRLESEDFISFSFTFCKF